MAYLFSLPSLSSDLDLFTQAVRVRLINKNSAIASPCVRNCCLDDQDVCVGCFRTLDEIKAWLNLSDVERSQVLTLAKSRRKQKMQSLNAKRIQ